MYAHTNRQRAVMELIIDTQQRDGHSLLLIIVHQKMNAP